MKNILLIFLFLISFVTQSFSQQIELEQIDTITFLDRGVLKEYLSTKYEILKPKTMQFQRLAGEKKIEKWEVKTNSHLLSIVKETNYKGFPMKIYLDGKVLAIPKEMTKIADSLSKVVLQECCVYVYQHDGREILIVQFSIKNKTVVPYPIYLIDTRTNSTLSIRMAGTLCDKSPIFLMKKTHKDGTNTLLLNKEKQFPMDETDSGKQCLYIVNIFKMYNKDEKPLPLSYQDMYAKDGINEIKESFRLKYPNIAEYHVVFNFVLQEGASTDDANLISCSVSYELRGRDTLTSIAKNMGITLQELLDLNKNIKDKDNIKNGQEIVIFRTK